MLLVLLLCTAVRLSWFAKAHGGASDGDSVPGSWPCFGQNTQHQAAATGSALWNKQLWKNASATGEEVEAYQYWHYHTGSPIRSSPVLGYNSHHIYVVAADGVLHAVHAKDDTEHWNKTLGTSKLNNSSEYEFHPSATVSPDGAFVFAIGPGSGELYKIRATDGTLIWTVQLGSTSEICEAFSSPACSADGASIFIGCDRGSRQDEGSLFKIDISTGTILWTADIPSKTGTSSVAVSTDEKLVFVGAANGRIHSHLSIDGGERWSSSGLDNTGTSTGDLSHSTPTLSRDGAFIYIGGDDGKLHALFASDGSRMWQYPQVGSLGPIRSSPAISNDDSTIFVGSSDGLVHAIDSKSGKGKWAFKVPGGFAVLSSPTITADGTLVFGCLDNYVRALNASTGKLLWKFLTDAPIVSSPAISGDGRTIYIGGLDTKLHAIRLRMKADSIDQRFSSPSSSEGNAINPSPTPDIPTTNTQPSSSPRHRAGGNSKGSPSPVNYTSDKNLDVTSDGSNDSHASPKITLILAVVGASVGAIVFTGACIVMIRNTAKGSRVPGASDGNWYRIESGNSAKYIRTLEMKSPVTIDTS